MSATPANALEPIRVVQPCSEACIWFRPLPGNRWPDFGWCLNPVSPFHGGVVRIGRECSHYQTTLPAARVAGG